MSTFKFNGEYTDIIENDELSGKLEGLGDYNKNSNKYALKDIKRSLENIDLFMEKLETMKIALKLGKNKIENNLDNISKTKFKNILYVLTVPKYGDCVFVIYLKVYSVPIGIVPKYDDYSDCECLESNTLNWGQRGTGKIGLISRLKEKYNAEVIEK